MKRVLVWEDASHRMYRIASVVEYGPGPDKMLVHVIIAGIARRCCVSRQSCNVVASLAEASMEISDRWYPR